MATNPIPSRITSEFWRFWEEFLKLEPGTKLGGIYANKRGYHNARDLLPITDYSVQLPGDKLGPGWAAAAIDLTMGPEAMKRYSARLMASGKDTHDERGNVLKEFFGTLDGTHVTGWDFQHLRLTSSDTSHLWHIHISVTRAHVAQWATFDALLSILKGESVAAWRARNSSGPVPSPTPAPAPTPTGPGLVLLPPPRPGVSQAYQVIEQIAKYSPYPAIRDRWDVGIGPTSASLHNGGWAVDFITSTSLADRTVLRNTARWWARFTPHLAELIHSVRQDLGGGEYLVKSGVTQPRPPTGAFGWDRINACEDRIHVAMYWAPAKAVLDYLEKTYGKR